MLLQRLSPAGLPGNISQLAIPARRQFLTNSPLAKSARSAPLAAPTSV
jgi:hypothetical protein